MSSLTFIFHFSRVKKKNEREKASEEAREGERENIKRSATSRELCVNHTQLRRLQTNL